MKKIVLSILLITCAFVPIYAADIIPLKNQTILEDQNQKYGPKSEWIPSEVQTSKVLEAIYKFLNKELSTDWRNIQRKIILNQISSYRVQFVGILVDGQKVIHCNFYIENDSFEHDENTYVLVLDGGESYWQINYNVEKDTCFDFWVNGYS